MGIFQCCFSGDVERHKASDNETGSPFSVLGTMVGAPLEVDAIVSPGVAAKVPSGKLNNVFTEKERQDSEFSSLKEASNGLECALSLQAKLCAAGRIHSFPEARAVFLVDVIQKHLEAFAVRLYVLAHGCGTGAAQAVDGVLIQLAHAHSPGRSPASAPAAARHGGSNGAPSAQDSQYFCPRHEPVGSSSVLLRQATVSKVPVVLRCAPRQEPSEAVAATSLPPAVPPHGSAGNTPIIIGAAAAANSLKPFPASSSPVASVVAAAVATQSGSSGFSCCAVNPELEAAAAASRSVVRCCPDLDLTEADAVPGSPTVFAAVPLVYDTSTLGVLWIALPVADDDATISGGEGLQFQTGTGAVVTSSGASLGGTYSPPPPPLPQPPRTASVSLQQQQQQPQACRSSGRGATPSAPTQGLSISSAASCGPAALLANPAALELVAMSVGMHLAAGCADTTYLCRLGESLHGLAESATLAELVLELSSSLVQHVRQRFYVDAAAHAALVPAPDSRVAFMLRPERVDGPASMRAARHHQQQQQYLLTHSRLRMASTSSVASAANLLNLSVAPEASRSRSVTVLAQAAMSNSRRGNNSAAAVVAGAANANAAATAAANSTSTNGPRLSDLKRTNTAAATGDGLLYPSPVRACSLSALRASGPRDVFMLESGIMRSEGSFGMLSSCPGPAGAAGGGGLPPSLSARAFRLSSTLLQAMLQAGAAAATSQAQHRSCASGGGSWAAAGAGATATSQAQQQRSGGGCGGASGQVEGGRSMAVALSAAAALDRLKLLSLQSFDGDGSGAAAAGGGVLAGVCVQDCARHVQDERQPSRDVCMLMMSGCDGTRCGGGAGGGGTSAAVVSESVGAITTGSGGGGAQSLVLLGMETGDGAVLAVYLTFPTPAPIQLLEAVRNGCSVLLREHLACAVRHRLRCPDLAAEWETLRAGVPGSYLSVSRCSTVPPDAAGLSYTQSPLSQPGPRRAAPLLMMMSTGSNIVASAAQVSGGAAEEGGFLQSALLSSRGMSRYSASPHSRLTLGSVPGTAPAAVACSEASLVSLAPGMGGTGAGGGGGGCHQSGSHLTTEHFSATGLVSGGGGGGILMGRACKVSLTQGGMDDGEEAVGRLSGVGLTLGGPAWLQRSRRSASAVPVAVASARSSSARGFFLRFGNNAKQQQAADADTAKPHASAIRSPLNSGCFNGRVGDSATSPFGPLTTEADEDEAGTWQDAAVAGGGGGAAADAAATTAAAGGGGRCLTAAGMLTVHDLDETYESWGMRAHMGALVDSILSTTLRSSGAHLRGDEGGAGRGEMAAARVTEGLEELQLSAVLGQGASGVVLKGMLGCTPVAVKIMEMPDADGSIGACRSDVAAGGGPVNPRTGLADPQSSGEDGGGGGGGGGDGEGDAPHPNFGIRASPSAAVEPREVRARRALLRNAMEVALMRTISHVNIVQAFAVYDNVIMERHEGRQGIISLRRINQKDASDQKVPDATNPSVLRSSPICTAIVLELCDRGSLADVLHNRSFPALPLPPPLPSASPASTAGAAMQYARYWKGIYMTLLEIALALRHLHSRRLVHRDLKPGNVLLKSSPGDPRGWTCKLADFGFALVLDEFEQQGREDPGTPLSQGFGVASHCCSPSSSSQIPAASLPSPQLPFSNQPSSTNGTSAPSGGPRDWFTIQQHIGGTVTHMAPEAFRKGSRIDASVDVFSFGVIMWELVCGRGHRPYKDISLEAVSAAVTNGTRPMFPPGDHVPMPYRQLARACWSADPRLRPGSSEVVAIVKGLLESARA